MDEGDGLQAKPVAFPKPASGVKEMVPFLGFIERTYVWFSRGRRKVLVATAVAALILLNLNGALKRRLTSLGINEIAKGGMPQ